MTNFYLWKLVTYAHICHNPFNSFVEHFSESLCAVVFGLANKISPPDDSYHLFQVLSILLSAQDRKVSILDNISKEYSLYMTRIDIWYYKDINNILSHVEM